MLKCCGCQTNFILPLGGSFLFSKNFLPTPSLTGGLVMPIRRTIKRHLEISPFLGVFSGVPIEAPHTLQVNYNTINSMNLSSLSITQLRIVVL